MTTEASSTNVFSTAVELKAAPWPCFAEDEIEAATAVLRSGQVNYWTGEQGRNFEKEFATVAGCKYAVALANGTVALELALRGLGVGAGDEVITPARSYFASASCIVAVGARPVFADIDRDAQTVTAETIRMLVTPKTKVILVVHLAGWPCDMDSILNVAREFNLKVIEDCAQAHGATYRGQPVGSFGDVAAFSFCQDKIITTAGEGGMVTTNSEALWERMWAYKDNGLSFHAVYGRNHPPGFRWLRESFGTNWRLSEVQSAVGRVQLKKLSEWTRARRTNAAVLSTRLARHAALRVAQPPEHLGHAFYRFYAFVESRALAPGWSRDRIAQAVAAQGVACTTGSCSEIYLEAAFPPELRPRERLVNARELGATSLAFLVHPTLTHDHMQHAADVLEQVLLDAEI